MLTITSRDNPRLKQVRAIRDSANKDLIFVEGLRLATEVLRSKLNIVDVFFSETFSESESGRGFGRELQNVRPIAVKDKIFDSLADTKNSQGVIVICEKPSTGKHLIEKSLSNKSTLPLVVLLHKINNPSNLGAILRTCEAVNVAGVILTNNSTDAFSPKALRGAMGASFRLPLWMQTDFAEAIKWAKIFNLISICADVKAQKNYLEIDWRKPRLLIFGSEAQGLDEFEKSKTEESLLIPMENNVESLNLAVSCGIVLFEVKRQLNINE